MADPLDQVLRLVAEGRLSAAEAAPILDALAEADAALGNADAAVDAARRAARNATAPDRPADPDEAGTSGANPTALRIEVSDGGRKVMNLRIPVNLGRLALDRIPGLSGANTDLIRQALAEHRTGTLLAVDDDGDGVRISLE
jgi:hypothetical protein